MATTARAIARELAKTMQCRCDLDNWEPTRETGHSWVCPIHREASALLQRSRPAIAKATGQ